MTRLQARITALAMLGGSAALAQVPAPERAQVQVQLAGPATGAAAAASLPPDAAPLPAAPPVTTDALRRAHVVDASGADLGEIVDFVLSSDAEAEGQISHVVIALGGVLGVGRHAVAVPYSQLSIAPAGDGALRISLPWTEAQLRSVPEWAPDNPASLGLSGPDESDPADVEAAP